MSLNAGSIITKMFSLFIISIAVSFNIELSVVRVWTGSFIGRGTFTLRYILLLPEIMHQKIKIVLNIFHRNRLGNMRMDIQRITLMRIEVSGSGTQALCCLLFQHLTNGLLLEKLNTLRLITEILMNFT